LLGVGCWVLGIGYWVLGIGYWVLWVGLWRLVGSCLLVFSRFFLNTCRFSGFFLNIVDIILRRLAERAGEIVNRESFEKIICNCFGRPGLWVACIAGTGYV
jgi:hypothetical protein